MSNLRLNTSIERIVMEPGGPGERYVKQKGYEIVAEASRLASGVLVNVRTGRYRSSISHDVVNNGNLLMLYIRSGVEYGKFLEYGTRYMAARRVLQTAVDNTIR